MLKVNLMRSSEAELAKEVTERCSSLGTVNKVTVYAANADASVRPIAIVGMGTREAAMSVSGMFDGRTVGSAVVVFLEQLADTVRSQHSS